MSIKEMQDCFKKQKSVPSCRTQWLVAFRVVLGNAVSQWGPREMWGCGLPRTGTKSGHSVWACCRPAGSRPGLAGRWAAWPALQGHCLFSAAFLGLVLVFVQHRGPAVSHLPTHSQSAVEKSLRRILKGSWTFLKSQEYVSYAELNMCLYLFCFEILAPCSVSVRCRWAAVRRTGVGCLCGDGLRLWHSGRFSFRGFIGHRLHRLSWRAGRQVRTSADGASSSPLLPNVSAVSWETFPVPRAFNLGWL